MDGSEPGSRARPRLEDVAAAVGLSTASVSLVLRGAEGPSAATRERVLEAATRLGYRPDRAASLLARRRSRLIGVMLDIRSDYHGELVEDLHDVAEQQGYDLVLSTTTRTRDERRAVETLLDSRCEALVLLGSDAPASWLAELDRRLPVVVVGRAIGSPGVDVVRAADELGVSLAVDHLVGLGHEAVAYVDGGDGEIAAARRHGYERAMVRSGLAGAVRVLPGDHTEESGIEAGIRTAAALAGPGSAPTAVVTFNDRVAVGLLDALSRAGVAVPDDISVVGYDDSPLSRLAHVGLTTVSQNSRALVEHAVTAVVERLDAGRTTHSEVVLPPHLVLRTTTAAPRPAVPGAAG